MHLNIDIVYEEPQSKIFFKMPKVLFTDKYKGLSAEAKLLYGLMLDRMNLSAINGWCDKNGEVFIFYTIAETSEMLGADMTKQQDYSVSLKNIIYFAVNIRVKANLQSYMF